MYRSQVPCFSNSELRAFWSSCLALFERRDCAIRRASMTCAGMLRRPMKHKAFWNPRYSIKLAGVHAFTRRSFSIQMALHASYRVRTSADVAGRGMSIWVIQNYAFLPLKTINAADATEDGMESAPMLLHSCSFLSKMLSCPLSSFSTFANSSSCHLFIRHRTNLILLAKPCQCVSHVCVHLSTVVQSRRMTRCSMLRSSRQYASKTCRGSPRRGLSIAYGFG